MPRGRVKQFTDEQLKEKRIAREQKYYQKNKEKIVAKVRARYYATQGKEIPPVKEKLPQEELTKRANARARQYRINNPDSVKANDKRQAAKRKGRTNIDHEYSLKLMITSARTRSSKLNREFDIDLEYIKLLWEKQKGLCNLTKMPMAGGVGSNNKFSIDRINSSRGYIKGNCQLVIAMVNKAKLDLDQEEFVNLCKAVAQNN